MVKQAMQRIVHWHDDYLANVRLAQETISAKMISDLVGTPVELMFWNSA